jgi:hypothetical protein
MIYFCEFLEATNGKSWIRICYPVDGSKDPYKNVRDPEHFLSPSQISDPTINYLTVTDLERVLSGEQMDDLEGVLYNPHGHQLLAWQEKGKVKSLS